MYSIRQDAALQIYNIQHAEPEKLDRGNNTCSNDRPRTLKRVQTQPAPLKSPPQRMRPWKVLLHNDDINEMVYVVETIMVLTPLNKYEAIIRMLEAHTKGKSLLLTTHRERAELYWEQFASRGVIVTIKPV